MFCYAYVYLAVVFEPFGSRRGIEAVMVVLIRGVGVGVVFEAVGEFDTVLPVNLGVSDLWVSIREVEILGFAASGFLINMNQDTCY